MSDPNTLIEKIEKGEQLSEDEMKEVMEMEPKEAERIDIAQKSRQLKEGAGKKDDKPADKKDDKSGKLDGKKDDKTAGKTKADDKKEAKADDKAADDKNKTDGKEAAAAGTAVDIDKLNKELEKPEGKEDLSGYNDREKAYFWSMRRDRRARQEAERERDEAKFKLTQKIKADADAEAKKKAEADAKEAESLLEGKADEEPVSVADVKKIITSIKKQMAPVDRPFVDVQNPIVRSYLVQCDKSARETLGGDYEEVVECTQDIVTGNEGYMRQVADAIVKGENPAILIYNLIKGDPAFPTTLPKVQARLKAAGKLPEKSEEDKKKEADALAEQKRLEESQNKARTSAHGTIKDDKSGREYTLEEITAMSDREFGNLSKKTREEYLHKYGV